jgi:hypothetical protein
MHESHCSMVSPSALGDVDEGNILTNNNSNHSNVVGQMLLEWHDMKDRFLVTKDQITWVLTRTDGVYQFVEDPMCRP